MSETLNITIDGVSCTCEKGEYLYDIAKRNGIYIPVLCRSDAFEDHRACCRICIVEVEIRGRRKVVTSCVYPVEEECTVYVNSEKMKRERAMVMQLLTKRAPESERIAQSAEFLAEGRDYSRLISLDTGKCILCGLCVQACDSLGAGAISTVNRGTDKQVNTPYGAASDDCLGCLSCANVCPTGEITFTEDEMTRTIWNRSFELVRCEECGEVIGTAQSVAYARGEDADESMLCDACRKSRVAQSMMQTYRLV